VAGATAKASKSKDEPDPTAGGNAPSNTSPAGSSPLIGMHRLPKATQAAPSSAAMDKEAGTSVAIAAAVAVNHITDVTQASLADANVTADAVDVKANNQNHIVSATGGLALSKTDSGGNAPALAGAFSYNGINATVNAFVRDAALTVSSMAFDVFVVKTAEKRFSLTADNVSHVWTLAAGGAGAVAAGGTGGGGGGGGSSFAGSLAGSVSVNTLLGSTRARLFDSKVHLEADDAASDAALVTNDDSDAGDEVSDARVRATDDSSIFAIAGSLSLSIAKGNKGGATALAAGVAIAVNNITTDIDALVASSQLLWADGSAGGFDLEGTSKGTIKAFTVAGAVGPSVADQKCSGVAATGAGAGSVNQISADTTATLLASTGTTPGAVIVHASNQSEIIAAAGALSISIVASSKGTAAA